MFGKILEGGLEVVTELASGITENFKELKIESDKLFGELNTKMMGSYEDIEKFDAEKKEQS
jgi:hypothetical protein